MPIPNQRPRVLGSAFTAFHWQGKIIGFAQEVRITSVQPVAPPSVIHPINTTQPVEILTPGAHSNGVITLVLTELYNQPVWNRLSVLTGSNDIVDIMRAVAEVDQGIKLTKYVKPPKGIGNGQYSEVFHDCVITRVADDEVINIASMEVNKEIEVWYTYSDKIMPGVSKRYPRVF